VSETLTQIFRSCPFLFPFQTRLLFFKLISFIGSIDMNRSIFFLRQFLKHKLGKLPSEEKNAVKIQRQKVVVDRQKVLECSLNLMSKISNRAFLEVEYKDEVGTGLGPTLEFYFLVAQEIKSYKIPSSGQ
jgi:E3 ubiquitin-protein ligase TRIP12